MLIDTPMSFQSSAPRQLTEFRVRQFGRLRRTEEIRASPRLRIDTAPASTRALGTSSPAC